MPTSGISNFSADNTSHNRTLHTTDCSANRTTLRTAYFSSNYAAHINPATYETLITANLSSNFSSNNSANCWAKYAAHNTAHFSSNYTTLYTADCSANYTAHNSANC